MAAYDTWNELLYGPISSYIINQFAITHTDTPYSINLTSYMETQNPDPLFMDGDDFYDEILNTWGNENKTFP